MTEKKKMIPDMKKIFCLTCMSVVDEQCDQCDNSKGYKLIWRMK